jgi:hypothetical protein
VNGPRRCSGVEIRVGGTTYRANSYFNLRNILVGRRNAFNEAARMVEAAMEQEDDPLLTHLSRLERMP